jgi:hypothetical protein
MCKAIRRHFSSLCGIWRLSPLRRSESDSTRETGFPQVRWLRTDHSPCEVLGKFWLRRRAHRFKPATDVYLGVSFAAVVTGSGRVGSFKIPPVHGEIGISASNYEPVGWIGGNESTDLAPEFLHRCHVLTPAYPWLVTLTSTPVADLGSES